MVTTDALVLGRGIVGSACANLLAQAGLKTILLAPNAAAHPMATINNQGWLQSGSCLVFDPDADVRNISLRAFHEIEDLLALSGGQRTMRKNACVVTGSDSAAQRLNALPIGFEVDEVSAEGVRGQIGPFWQDHQRYFRVLDHPWRPELVADLMLGFALSQGVAVEGVEAVSFMDSVGSPSGVVVNTSRERYSAAHVFVCLGAGGPAKLDHLVPFASWPNLVPELGRNQLEVLQTALLLADDPGNLLVDMFVNMSGDWAAVRHKASGSPKASLIFSESRPIKQFSPLEQFPHLREEDTERLYRKVEKAGFVFRTTPKNHHCFRFERRILDPQNTFGSLHTVAPCAFTLPGYPHLAVGLSGKATFGLETARRMLTKAGLADETSRFIPRLPPLNFGGRLAFWASTH